MANKIYIVKFWHQNCDYPDGGYFETQTFEAPNRTKAKKFVEQINTDKNGYALKEKDEPVPLVRTCVSNCKEFSLRRFKNNRLDWKRGEFDYEDNSFLCMNKHGHVRKFWAGEPCFTTNTIWEN